MIKQWLDKVQTVAPILLILALAGCALPSRAAGPAKPVLPGSTRDVATAEPAPASPLAAPTTTKSGGSASAGRLYVTGEDQHGLSGLFVLDAASGAVERSLPSGYITPDWSTLYEVAPAGNSTAVRDYDIATGRLLRETNLPGRYYAPAPAEAPWPSAFSPDGRYLVLFREATDAEFQQWHQTGKPFTRILVLDTSFRAAPERVNLEGYFEFDALSSGGSSLYLIQTLGSGWPPEYSAGQSPTYQVRRYDLATARLDEQPVIDKSEAGPMNGSRHASVASRDGAWLYSLYTRQTEGPFVHVLNLNDRYAVCVDLPFSPADSRDFEINMMWSLALSPDGSTLYAVNPALGQVAAVDTQNFEARSATFPKAQAARPAMLAQLARWLAPVAEAKRLVLGGAAVSPDGETVYAVAADGLVAIATNDLSLRGRLMQGWALSSLALSKRGDVLYAASDEKGALMRLSLPAAGAAPQKVPMPGRPAVVVRADDGAQ